LRIVIAAHHYPVASGRYMADAFRRLGHEVKTIGPAHGQDIWGLSLPPAYVWTPDALTNEYRADVLIVMDSDPTFLSAMLNTEIAPLKIVYGVDNHVRQYVNGYDHYFLAHYHGPTMPVQADQAAHTWLPCGYDPTVFTPSPIDYDDRAYDVAMIGVMYPERRRLVNLLRDNGYKVYAGAGLVGANAAAVYQNARMSLCNSAAGDIAQRIFETAACGCLVLTDPLRDLLNDETNARLGFKGFAVYWSDKELLSYVHDFLNDERPLARQAVAMMPSVVAGQTWDDRATRIMEWVSNDAKAIR
jgi:hypothetical protein